MTEDQFGRVAGDPAGREAERPVRRQDQDQERRQDQERDRDQERELRALLQRAVAGVQPAPDALPRIRRAIPVRRARYRHTWTGAVLIALAAMAAVPTLHGLGALQLSDGSMPGEGSSHAATGAITPSPPPHRRGGHPVVPLPVPSGSGDLSPGAGPPSAVAVGAPTGGPTGPGSEGGGVTASADSAGGTVPATPACAAGDLGHSTVTLGPPDGSGRHYGAFTVADISGHACVLTDPGTVTAAVDGGGGGAIRVLAHQVGDAAPGLPDPATAPARLLLAPDGAYRLAFAWVPAGSCGSPGGGASPGGTGSTGGATASPGSGASGGPGPGGGGGPLASGAASPTAGPTGAGSASPRIGGPVIGGPMRPNGTPVGTGAGTATGTTGDTGTGTGTGGSGSCGLR
ncbi:hypothetical protein, partial [Kitasatospora nipponensis]|uniref:hypothetical protein n=1 Tax=Kitasatospora nipponensis TaxID=258049 RepID=UPI0031E3EF3F